MNRFRLRKRAAWALAFGALLAAGMAAAALEAGAAPDSVQATTTITTTLTTGTTTTVATITTTTPGTVTATTTTPVTTTTTTTKPKKVAVCHRTKSKKTPYTRVVVSGAALKAHLKHRLDIIPAPRSCPKHVVAVRNHKIVKKKGK